MGALGFGCFSPSARAAALPGAAWVKWTWYTSVLAVAVGLVAARLAAVVVVVVVDAAGELAVVAGDFAVAGAGDVFAVVAGEVFAVAGEVFGAAGEVCAKL